MTWSRTVGSLGARAVIRWLALAGWPVHLAFGVSTAATLVLAVSLDQPGVASALLAVTVHYLFGLCASFAIHELSHAVTLTRAPGVTAVTLERTLLRISVRPHGSIRGRDAFLCASLGPLTCVAVGALLWGLAPQLLVHVWYLGHAVFLTPVFPDGRIMIVAARCWNRVIVATP